MVGSLRLQFALRVAPCLCLVALATRESFARDPGRDPVSAEELFRQGVVAKKRGDWKTACEKFQKSMELEPAVSTQFKLANCDERVGKLAAAWLGYRAALKMNRETKSEARRSELDKSINDAIAALEPRIPKLRISVTPSDPALKLEIERDDVAVAPSSVLGEELPVEPGMHKIVVRAPGFVEQRVEVTAAEGKTVEAAINLVSTPEVAKLPAPEKQAATKPQGVAPVPQRTSESTSGPSVATIGNGQPVSPNLDSRRSTWGQKQTALVIGGVGVVTLGVAGYFGIKTLSAVGQFSDYKNPDGTTYNSGVNEPHDRALHFQRVGLVLAGAGAALTGVAIALYVTAPTSRSASRSAIVTHFAAQFTSAGAFVRGEW